jgi:hypothetical protein
MRLVICQASGGCLPAIIDAAPEELATIKRLCAALGLEVIGSPELDESARRALLDVAEIRTLDALDASPCPPG